MAYGPDILDEKDPGRRIENLRKLIADRTPTEILVLTAISVLSEDDNIRRVALERLDQRNREEGNTSARVVALIQSWRREGALMTWPKPMNDVQATRAARIESAHYVRSPLVSAVATESATPPAQTSSLSNEQTDAASSARDEGKPWWKFW